MTTPTYSYVLYPTLYAVDAPQSVTESWGDFCVSFATPRVVARKEDTPLFGPYRLLPDAPRRRDASVAELSLAVFDVDYSRRSPAGTPAPPSEAELENCAALLTTAGLRQLWYTTYSHHPEAPAYRLVIPLAQPLAPAYWPGLRAELIFRFAIPADVTKCSGVSHAYYLPACSAESLAAAAHYSGVIDGAPLVAASFGAPATAYDLRTAPRSTAPFTPPPEPTEPVDLRPLRARLEAAARRLATRRPKAAERVPPKQKAEWLYRLLRGEALAEHGSRNVAAATVAGVLGWALPEVSVGTLAALMEPSVAAMQAAGSSLTFGEVERMLLSALESKANSDARDAAFKAALENWSKRSKERP